MEDALDIGYVGTLALDGIATEDFPDIVHAHQRAVYRVLLLLVRDPDEADNLTQECFLRAYAARAGYRGQARLRTWLIRIAVNLVRDRGRNRKWQFWRNAVSHIETSPAAAFHADPSPSPEQRLLAEEQVRLLWTAVDGLPVQQRAAFVLRFAEEMSLEEIACAMDLELGTVKVHLARAVAAVRRQRKEIRS